MIIVVDTNADIFAKEKKYPYPMELINEFTGYILVKENGREIKINRSEIKKINRISSGRKLKKVK